MGLEKPSLAGCLSGKTHWLCLTVFTLTTHSGVGSALQQWAVLRGDKSEGTAVSSSGLPRASKSPSCFFEEEKFLDASSSISPLSC